MGEPVNEQQALDEAEQRLRWMQQQERNYLIRITDQ